MTMKKLIVFSTILLTTNILEHRYFFLVEFRCVDLKNHFYSKQSDKLHASRTVDLEGLCQIYDRILQKELQTF